MNDEILYDSDNWNVRRNEEGNIVITRFSDGHYYGEIEMKVEGKIEVLFDI